MKFLSTIPCLLLFACQTTPEVVIADDQVDNAWDYLAVKYDRDGDGRITDAEYTRSGGDFKKLDRNDDGVLDATDYPLPKSNRSRRSWNDMPADMKKRMGAMYAARAVVLTYLQPDSTAGSLSRDAMLAQFKLLDSDASDDLGESEFACATDARPWGGPGKAWSLMLAAIDARGDGDQRLSQTELLAYHKRLANDAGIMRGAPSGSKPIGDAKIAADGAPVGSSAPDFLLEPVGGGTPISVSQFRGDRPVALIFGSYT